MSISTIVCQRCNEIAPRRGQVQKYCAPCSETLSQERRRKWGRDNPRPFNAEKRGADIEKRRALGMQRSARAATSLQDAMPVNDLDAVWHHRFMVPFMGAASKNYIWGFSGKGGHVYKRKESNDYRTAITLKVKAAITAGLIKVHTNKVWIDLFIQKPTHKSDAVNVLDLICDALKEGLGVDDRWFCVRRLDWEIVKVNPQIYIGISQTEDFDAQACSYCGSIKPLSDFGKKKSNKNGHSRICMVCSSVKSPIETEAA